MESQSNFKEKSAQILAEIQKASSILLHCHPSPDPDSVGAALGMKYALEQLGKQVTVIRGDSPTPSGFMHFPGATEILPENMFEIDLNSFDLFISIDSGSKEMVSRVGEVVFPDTMKVIVIDHHRTNSQYGHINLVDPTYPAACQILFDLFKEWQIRLTPPMATNLFMGIYTDTGGFKFDSTNADTFRAAAELVSIAKDFSKTIAIMENSSSPEHLAFIGLALSNIETSPTNTYALSTVSSEALSAKKITAAHLRAGHISSMLRSVGSWSIVGALIEVEPNLTKSSFRTANANLYDVSRLASALGGGGHKAAAAAIMTLPLAAAKALVVSKIKELYNL